MKYRSKVNKISNVTRAILALRIIDTVFKSGIEDAKESKRFKQLEEVNERYQIAIEPGDAKQVKEAIDSKFDFRGVLFGEIYIYLEGLQNSPDAEMQAAANLLFLQINKFGKNFSKYKIADQSLRYIRIIEALKKPEYAPALLKTLLTAKMAILDQVQLDYEELYMGKGNSSATKVAPSNLSSELNVVIKRYMDEVELMASRIDTEEWNTLFANLQKRFDEVSVSASAKSKTDPDTQKPSAPEAA